MDIFIKIKALHLAGKKGFRLLMLLEGILLCFGIAGLFGSTAVYEYGPEDMRVNFGAYSEEYGGILAEGSEVQGSMVDFAAVSLPRGVYRVQLYYTTDMEHLNTCSVTDRNGEQEIVSVNLVGLYSGLDHTDFYIWLKRDSEPVVHVNYRAGKVAVQGLVIRETKAGSCIALFGMLVFFAAVDSLYLYFAYDRKYHIPAKNKTVTFCLGLIILIASVPFMVDYMVGGGDIIYHLMRVEGIKDGIRAGRFPVRISPEWQQGYGYASPVFYGETLIYPAGLLRLMGFTVTDSYRLYMLAVTAATVLIAYYCFKKIFQEAYVGLFCSLLYSLSVYRIYKTYICSAWGECLGIMLLPLLVYGFFRVFSADVNEDGYKRSWVPLCVGFSLILQSHLLTGELAGFFTILLCILLVKKVFRARTFLVLAKTVVYSVLLSAWFLVPFADYMSTGDFIIHHVSERRIQFRGLYPAHLLFTYYKNGSTVFFDQLGMWDSDPMGVGIPMLAALLVLIWLWAFGRLGRPAVETLSKKSISGNGLSLEEAALGKISAGFAILSMFMSLSLFPWDRIQDLGGMAATLVSSIQFPNRLLMISNVCLAAVGGVAAKYVLSVEKRWQRAGFFGGMALLVLVGNIYLLDHVLYSKPATRAYNQESIGTGYISGAEYLPYGADASRFIYHDPVCTEGVAVYGYEKLSLGAEGYFVNESGADGSVRFPLLYYKGYQSWDMDSGEALACRAGENFEVTVDLPAGYSGRVKVEFVSPWYWRAGEAVSLLTLVAMAGNFARRRHRMAKRKTQTAERETAEKETIERQTAEREKADEAYEV